MKKLRFLFAFILVFMLSACGQAPPTASPVMTQQPSPSGPAVENVTNKKMTLTFAFGEREGTYSGDVVNDLPHGNGVFTTLNTEGVNWTYEGGWENGHLSGNGKTVWSDGYVIEGTYKNDRLNGTGRTYQDNALVYEGNYKDDEYDGQGTLYDMHGNTLFAGTFENGYLVESAADRKARLDTFKKQCVAMPYSDFMDAGKTKQLIGAKVMITGTITEIYKEDKGDEEYFEFWMAADDVEKNLVGIDYILSKGEAKLKEGTRVTMWGTFEELYTFTDDGKKYTEPYFNAWSVEAAPEPTPTKTPVKTPVKTAAPTKSIVNTWICQQGQYTSIYTFNKNGTYEMYAYDNQGDYSEAGKYTAKNGNLRLGPYQSEYYNLKYKFSGSKLILTYPDGESFTYVVYEP
ncbi:MAG: hypothetical protein ACOYU3_04990 [Bacillota bacterium]